MEIVVTRKTFTDKSTIGDMEIDGEFFCYTLEDTVRAPGVKVPAKTAIPAGRYRLVVDMSARFGKLMPHILDVPMFSGIRIHKGNTDKDTEGCIIVGMAVDDDFVGQSKLAYDKLMAKLNEELKDDGKAFIEILNKDDDRDNLSVALV